VKATMAKRFEGRVVLVTGGTSGIGKATVFGFVREGAKVAFTGRREKEGNQVVEQVKAKLGVTDDVVLFARGDVSNADDVKLVIEKTVGKFGRLDVAFNNAGVEQGNRLPIHEQSEEEFDRVMNINVRGLWLCLRAEISQMLKNEGGRIGGSIVNMSSISGLIGVPNFDIYVGSKHAVVGLTKSVALTYAKNNIRVNSVNPGGVDTEMLDRIDGARGPAFDSLHPLGRVATVQEVADLILFLCSDQASFITGQAYPIDGGFTTQ